MNLPNILTAIRFIIIPFFGYCLFTRQYYLAVFLFTMGGITDIMDGYIARKYNLVTSFGKLADPVADKLMQLTAFIILTLQGLIPIVFLIVVMAKETFMVLGSITLYKKQNHVVSANWYGKLATVIFYIAIVATILLQKLNVANSKLYIDVITGVAVLFALFAFLMYSLQYREIRSEKK
ncbi:MAG: CDP-diacylglycerol--glycerol-3-phosphate 3-phosphatidyltransferase [Clostridia bacterium]|nr:CDP-diacylglycerol--glycerol-3-phosphate 3-phosphatidyltransferase [Clostridia bacterium]